MQVTKEMIEAGARAIHAYRSSALWQEMTGQWQEHCRGEAKAGLEAALSAMWQPIETAPRDGTLILGYDPYYLMRVIKFDPLSGSWLTDLPFDVERGGRELRVEPTHWMPLPPTPETK